MPRIDDLRLEAVRVDKANREYRSLLVALMDAENWLARAPRDDPERASNTAILADLRTQWAAKATELGGRRTDLLRL